LCIVEGAVSNQPSGISDNKSRRRFSQKYADRKEAAKISREFREMTRIKNKKIRAFRSFFFLDQRSSA
jgi:hypothetical protein